MKRPFIFSIILLVTLFFASTFDGCRTPNYRSQYPDCNSTDIEQLDTCLLRRPLRHAIDKLKLDTSQFYAFDEPPGILRGIVAELADTCEIRIYIDRASIIDKKDSLYFRQLYLHIIDKSVIGVSWTKAKQKNKGKTIFINQN